MAIQAIENAVYQGVSFIGTELNNVRKASINMYKAYPTDLLKTIVTTSLVMAKINPSLLQNAAFVNFLTNNTAIKKGLVVYDLVTSANTFFENILRHDSQIEFSIAATDFITNFADTTNLYNSLNVLTLSNPGYLTLLGNTACFLCFGFKSVKKLEQVFDMRSREVYKNGRLDKIESKEGLICELVKGYSIMTINILVIMSFFSIVTLAQLELVLMALGIIALLAIYVKNYLEVIHPELSLPPVAAIVNPINNPPAAVVQPQIVQQQVQPQAL